MSPTYSHPRDNGGAWPFVSCGLGICFVLVPYSLCSWVRKVFVLLRYWTKCQELY